MMRQATRQLPLLPELPTARGNGNWEGGPDIDRHAMSIVALPVAFLTFRRQLGRKWFDIGISASCFYAVPIRSGPRPSSRRRARWSARPVPCWPSRTAPMSAAAGRHEFPRACGGFAVSVWDRQHTASNRSAAASAMGLKQPRPAMRAEARQLSLSMAVMTSMTTASLRSSSSRTRRLKIASCSARRALIGRLSATPGKRSERSTSRDSRRSGNGLEAGHRNAALKMADRLGRHVELPGKLLLRHALGETRGSQRVGDVFCELVHDPLNDGDTRLPPLSSTSIIVG